jgi:programmed cell death protein 5
MSSHNPSDEGKSTDAKVTALKEQALRTLLSPEARLRLNNVKMVKPDLASMVENYLLGMASQGRLNNQISDDELKQILLSIQQPKREFKINRK